MAVISFILPMPARVPIGGYKIIFEYADRLAKKHEVNIIYSLSLPYINYKYPLIIRYFAAQYILNNKRWYSFQNTIQFKIIRQIDDTSIPNSDVIVATAWETSYPISKLSERKGEKVYLIQGYEIWNGRKDLVEYSYKLGLKNIVITKWLEEKVKDVGGIVYTHIPNGINLANFKLKTKIEDRNPYSIAMMYHTIESKGSKNGLEALNIVQNLYENISITLFGVVPKNKEIPLGINYVCNPSLEELVNIYNSNAIFICSSWSEGFGLTGAEALACGCALATTDNGGCRDYAINEQTALISPPQNSDALAKNIIRFLEDNKYRIKIAKQGYDSIQKFAWKHSIQAFEEKIIGKKLFEEFK